MRRIAPDEQRRVRVLSLLFGGHVVMALVAGVLTGADMAGHQVVHLVSVTLAALAAVGMIVNVMFPLAQRRLRLPLPPIVRDLVSAAAYLVVIIILLGRAGINVAGLVATSAVLTAVVGLSLQDTLGNLVAGLTLQSDSAVRLGEWLQIGDVQGRVVEMRWRFTALETRDGETLVVPNAVLIKDKIRILGRRQGQPSAWRRWVKFSVDYRVPHTDVIDAVLAAFRDAPLPAGATGTPPIDCIVLDFGPGTVQYALRYWLTELAADAPVDSQFRRRITAALARAGIDHATTFERRVVMQDTHLVESRATASLSRRTRAMRRIAALSLLPPADQESIAAQMIDAPFEPGEIIFRQGGAPDSAYVIDEGQVSIRIVGHDGTDHEIARLGPGDVLGEMGVMTGEPRSATAVALTSVRTCKLWHATLESLMRNRPDIAEALAKILAERKIARDSAREKLDADVSELKQRESTRVLASIRSFFGLDVEKTPRS